jgi:DNA helicase-2/ATP-dependent DNA helicase PcrA
VEPVDSEDLYEAARRIDGCVGFARAVAVFDFAAECMTRIGTELASVRKALEEGRPPKTKKYPEQVGVLLAICSGSTLSSVTAALESLSKIPCVVVHRRELLSEMIRALRVVVTGQASDLSTAAWSVRDVSRQRGRVFPRCAVGTTLLVKGLECDHAVVFNADAMDPQNLYVAMTRGSRSLTVLSKSRCVTPKAEANGVGAIGSNARRRFRGEEGVRS